MEQEMEQKIIRWTEANGKKIHTCGCSNGSNGSNGLIVVGPPGIGKSHFTLKNDDWVDADDIFRHLGVHTKSWHKEWHSADVKENHYRECDKLLL